MKKVDKGNMGDWLLKCLMGILLILAITQKIQKDIREILFIVINKEISG